MTRKRGSDPKHVEDDVFRDFDLFFVDQLLLWMTEEEDWPKNRTLQMFKAWFEIELHSVVEDLCDYEIVDEDNEA